MFQGWNFFIEKGSMTKRYVDVGVEGHYFVGKGQIEDLWIRVTLPR